VLSQIAAYLGKYFAPKPVEAPAPAPVATNAPAP